MSTTTDRRPPRISAITSARAGSPSLDDEVLQAESAAPEHTMLCVFDPDFEPTGSFDDGPHDAELRYGHDAIRRHVHLALARREELAALVHDLPRDARPR